MTAARAFRLALCLLGISGAALAQLTITTPSPLPAGTVTGPYSQPALVATGGVTPYSWSITSGALPPGFNPLPSTGVITGTPTTAGPYSFTATVTDSTTPTALTAARSYSITINPAPTVDTTSPLPPATANAVYPTRTLAATGGTPPLGNWSITTGALPAGLTLAPATGAISGTPTATGTFNFTVAISDANNVQATKALQLVVSAAPTISTTSPLPPATANAVYPTQTLAATGGTPPLGNWSIIAGALPAGLTLTAATGAISGTPTPTGTFNFTVAISDANSVQATKALQLVVNAPPSITTTSPLPPATASAVYPTRTLAATGGTPPLGTWSITTGALPAGLTLSPAAGTISGTPTATGTFNFTVAISDANNVQATKVLQLVVSAAPIITTTSPLPPATANALYPTQTLAATGGTPPLGNWSIIAGALPAGLTPNLAAGTISGTPTATGTFNFTVAISDANNVQATKALQLVVNAPPSITTTSPLPAGTVGQTSSLPALQATGGTGSLTWSWSGTTPPGLNLSAAGVLTGTLTTAGTFNFTVQVQDANAVTASKAFALTVNAVPTITTTSPLPPATANAVYPTQTLLATGGSPPLGNWSIIAGTLPAGLTLTPATGAISGTPSVSGTFNFTVQIPDANNVAASKALQLVVNPPPSITTSSPLPGATVNAAYSQTLAASGGTGAHTWSISTGALPAGLILAPATGVISGTPTSGGSVSFIAQVADSLGATATKSLTINVAFGLSVGTNSPLPNGAVNAAYSQTLGATGGTSPYTWAVTAGALPAGLTLNTSTGIMTGTPTTAGTANFTVQVTDTLLVTATKALALTIAPALAISTTSPLPGGAVGSAYFQALVATGGTSPYTWSVTAGSLPGGVTLTGFSGVLSGTPATAATFSFTIGVSDSVGVTASKSISITITPPLLVSTASPLAPGTVGVAYSQTLAATGGTTPYTWSVSTGSLPGGLALNSSTGAITGTPGSSGAFSFVVQVADSAGSTTTKGLSITIAAALSITTASPLTAGTVGSAYSQALAATGGTSPYSWSVSAGTLPAGLTLSSSTGTISGTPSTAGTANITIHVSDAASVTATKAFALTVVSALSITTSAALPNGAVGAAYSQTLAASGGTAPYAWSLTAGALPAGLTLNVSTGAIAGTPLVAGTSNFTIRVADSASLTTTTAFTLTIASGLTVASASPLANGAVGAAYASTLAAVGGTPPYTWTITSGSLPAALALNASTGAITGTPTTAVTSNFTVQVSDSFAVTSTKSFALTIAPVLVVTSTSPLATGAIGSAYSQTLAASGGTAPYTWSVTGGALPAGLALNPSSGALTGTPSAVGTFSFTVQVADSVSVTAGKTFSLTIAPALTISTASLPNGTVGAAYAQTLAVTGGTSPYAWTIVSGALPGGLTLGASGAISGTLSAAGSASFTVQVSDSVSVKATKAFSITVANPLVINTPSPLPPGTGSVAYAQTIAATGGTPPYTWSVVAGAVPGGLSLGATNGVLGGTPSGSGAFTFTVQVADIGGLLASKSFAVTVAPPLAILGSAFLPGGTAGGSYQYTFAATGGTPPYAWSTTAGKLPDGTTLSSTGTVSGTPAVAGTFTVTIQVADSIGVKVTAQFNIPIASVLVLVTDSLPNGVVGARYSQQLSGAGGTPPYTWTITDGAAPAGVTLDRSTGVISGIPTTTSTASFTVRLEDQLGAVTTRPLGITVAPPLNVTTTSPLRSGTASVSYSTILAATGGNAPYGWALTSGALPAGLTLVAATGQIQGTPSTAGTFTFTVRATDSVGVAATKDLTLTIDPPPSVPVIASDSSLPPGTQGAPYSQTLQATGGASPYSWSLLSGSLPAGLSLNSASGVISGTPATAGSTNFTVQVTDRSNATASKAFTLVINVTALAIATASPLPAAVIGTGYSQTFSASGGAPPYTWSISAGSLPNGISFNASTGALTGTGTTQGTSSFTVQVKDSAGTVVAKAFSLSVQLPPLEVTTAQTLPAAVLGSAYSQTLAATGGTPPYTWSVSSGALPAGLSLTASGGVIAGTPTVAGAATFTIQVADSAGASASQAITLPVIPPNVPAVSISGPPATADPAQQPNVDITLAAVYPVALTGQLRISFAPDAANPSDDPAIQFSSGGRTVNFSIAANSTKALFSSSPIAMQTGTVAGIITLTAALQAGGTDVTPSPAPSLAVRVFRAAPVIRGVTVTRTANGLQVQVTGYSTPREISQAVFRFTAASGSTLTATDFTVALTSVAASWYQDPASVQYGSQFTLTQPFTIDGSVNAVVAVSVTLSNAQGNSQAVSASF